MRRPLVPRAQMSCAEASVRLYAALMTRGASCVPMPPDVVVMETDWPEASMTPPSAPDCVISTPRPRTVRQMLPAPCLLSVSGVLPVRS